MEISSRDYQNRSASTWRPRRSHQVPEPSGRSKQRNRQAVARSVPHPLAFLCPSIFTPPGPACPGAGIGGRAVEQGKVGSRELRIHPLPTQCGREEGLLMRTARSGEHQECQGLRTDTVLRYGYVLTVAVCHSRCLRGFFDRAFPATTTLEATSRRLDLVRLQPCRALLSNFGTSSWCAPSPSALQIPCMQRPRSLRWLAHCLETPPQQRFVAASLLSPRIRSPARFLVHNIQPAAV